MNVEHYKTSEIAPALRAAGLKRGDSVYAQSNLGLFGVCEDARASEAVCGAFLQAFLEVLGPEGTLIVPTYTYSACHGERFDPASTPSSMGVFAEYVRSRPEALRSCDPIFSVAALGPKARFYTENPSEKSLGPNCFFERLHRSDGMLCCLNFVGWTTFIHYVECSLQVAYRYSKTFTGEVLVNGVWEKRRAAHFVVDGEANKFTSRRLHPLCLAGGITQTAPLGGGTVFVEHAPALYDFIREQLKTRPRLLTMIEEEDVEAGTVDAQA